MISLLDSTARLLLKFMLLGLAPLLILLAVASNPTSALAATRPDERQLSEAIALSSRYLAAKFGQDGMFEYLDNMNPEVAEGEGYNILRHAGTIYALSMAYQQNPDKQVLKTMVRAGQYLHIESMGPVPGRKDLLAVWSRPEVSGEGETLEAKLGGNGLGLVALLSLEPHVNGFTPPEALRKLGNFILFMQKKDGSFYSKYAPDQGGYQKDFVSLYYPGEAALGLLMLYEKYPLDIWHKSAVAALTYLALSRKHAPEVPADHWALLATAKLFSFPSKQALPYDRELLLSHAIQICQTLLAGQVTSTDRPQYYGGFTPDGLTTPTATRLEGLLAALTFIPQEHAMYRRIETAVHIGSVFLLNAQVKSGEYAGAFSRAATTLPPDAPGAKDFNRRATEIRVDYIQHALSAMTQYHGFLKASRADITRP